MKRRYDTDIHHSRISLGIVFSANVICAGYSFATRQWLTGVACVIWAGSVAVQYFATNRDQRARDVLQTKTDQLLRELERQ
jgi:hypothetical protein